MGDPAAHRKLAEVIEVLREVDGVNVEQSSVVDLPADNPLKRMLTTQTDDGLLIMLRMDEGERLGEMPDTGDDWGEEVEIE